MTCKGFGITTPRWVTGERVSGMRQYCEHCGLDKRDVSDAAAELEIEDPICCEVVGLPSVREVVTA